MWNTCWQCGLYRVDKAIDPAGPAAICPECGFRHPFLQLPLLLVSGASGSGKSAVCQALLGQLPEAILLDSDILWRPEFDTPANHYRDFFETWLRMARNIGQSGQPVVLFGAGFGVLANLEPCVERRYFGDAPVDHERKGVSPHALRSTSEWASWPAPRLPARRQVHGSPIWPARSLTPFAAAQGASQGGFAQRIETAHPSLAQGRLWRRQSSTGRGGRCDDTPEPRSTS